jgi:hypothetical protein
MDRTNDGSGHRGLDKEEFIRYCWDNADTIFVREQLNGHWGAYSLNELSKAMADGWIETWWRENRVPVRVMEVKK